MTTTPHWNLLQLEQSQEGTVPMNEALRTVEAANHFAIVDRDLSAAPASPAAGAIYLVTGSPSDGIWDGETGNYALSIDGTQENWSFRSPAEGDVIIVIDENVKLIRTAAAWVFARVSETQAHQIASPSSSEDVTLFHTPRAITITAIRAVLRGSGSQSVTWTIRFASDRSAAGTEVVTSGTTTTSITTGDNVTSFNDATIPAGQWVWLETTALVATVDEFCLSIQFDADADY